MPKSRVASLRWPRTLASISTALAFALLAARPAAAEPPAWAPDELLVGYHASVSDEDADRVHGAHGGITIEKIHQLNVHRVRVPAHALESIEQALAHRPEVAFVERNQRLSLSLTANDTYYSIAWHLPKISAPTAWNVTQGSPTVVIAVLDSGVDPAHPDLAAKLVPGYNFVSNSTSTGDWNGHGTAVAGAAAAISNNDVGVTGVAWQSRIMPVVVADSAGYAYFSTVANGLTWSADHGAKVANLSIGGVAGSATITSAAQYAETKGTLTIAAAGNCGCVDSTPANATIVSVSATDQNDALASFSSRGDYVDISAPGVSIPTTAVGGSYMYAQGTSIASPVVSGVAALMMAANSSLTPGNVRTLLLANADDKGAPGWDSSFGYGRVNAYLAVAAAQASAPALDSTAPSVAITSPTGGSTVSGTATVAVSASDGVGVARVDLYVDGVFYGSDSSASYGFAWNTLAVSNGSHTLVAKAVDAAGNVGSSATVTVNVANVVDSEAPVVEITSASVIDNKLNASVSATDNVGVVRVDFLVDGKVMARSSTPPYSFSVSLSSLAPGTHTAQAQAYDSVGNTGTSAPVSFSKVATTAKKK